VVPVPTNCKVPPVMGTALVAVTNSNNPELLTFVEPDPGSPGIPSP
jgi:hypothetical protein